MVGYNGRVVFGIVGDRDKLLYDMDLNFNKFTINQVNQTSSGGKDEDEKIDNAMAEAIAYFNEPVNRIFSDEAHLYQFVMHSSLDNVDEQIRSNQSMYLRTIDEFNNMKVMAFVTHSTVKFLLLFDPESNAILPKSQTALFKQEEAAKNFFNAVNDLYTKLALNPFYRRNDLIKSRAFDERVVALANRYL